MVELRIGKEDVGKFPLSPHTVNFADLNFLAFSGWMEKERFFTVLPRVSDVPDNPRTSTNEENGMFILLQVKNIAVGGQHEADFDVVADPPQ